MEIKHTVEILTKDIQEIEKLVRNLNNSEAPPRIEFDLALSKLRNVYELLSLIRSDIYEEMQSLESLKRETAEEPVREEAPKTVEAASVTAPPVQPTAETPERKPEEIISAPVASAPVPHEPVAVASPKAPEVPEEMILSAPKPVEPTENQAAEEPSRKKKDSGILADKFNADRSLNDNIAATSQQGGYGSKISGKPIENIGKNIGINDRFLIIRELFNGDNDGYIALISQLDLCKDIDSALQLIKSRFPDDTEHEGVQLLTQLSRRKYITGGHV